MDVILEPIFPTGIMVIDDFLLQADIDSIVSFIRAKEQHQDDTTVPVNAYSTYDGSHNIMDEISKCVTLSEELDKKVLFIINEYAKNVLGLPAVQISNSWAHVQHKGSYIVEHTHPNSKVSGVLYLKADENSNNLVFMNPNPYNKIEAPIATTDFNYGNSTFPAKTGRLLLFPSWLEHGSNHLLNESDERIVISLNSKFNG